ncbi:MAG: hypothetical protein HY070_01860 [Chloroflexi bacterium]|nr:hypothetical protein [Chloroflexota bacterium]
MSANQTPPTSGRDADHWARPVEKLQVSKLPDGAINVAVAGRQLTGPIRGFGQLWQKTYRLKMIAPRTRMSGEPATPRDVIKAWKENFGSFWPRGNRFYSSLTQITPGDVAVLNLAGPVGMPLSTGVMVIYADDESFAFMTPQGHIFAGLITFSADQNDGDTSAQVQFLIRASDPIFEVAGTEIETEIINDD